MIGSVRGHRIKIKLICRLTKDRNQTLISISKIQEPKVNESFVIEFRGSKIRENELSLCDKHKFSNPFIIAT